MSIKKIAYASIIAAVYAGLTMFLAPISYGPLQFRVSEVLCILPFFFPFSVWGLFIGCIISNMASMFGIVDIVFGSLATLLAALSTMYIGKKSSGGKGACALACLPPVIFNGIIIGAVISFASTPELFWHGFLLNGLQVALGEAVIMFALGLPLMLYIPKTRFFREFLLRVDKR